MNKTLMVIGTYSESRYNTLKEILSTEYDCCNAEDLGIKFTKDNISHKSLKEHMESKVKYMYKFVKASLLTGDKKVVSRVGNNANIIFLSEDESLAYGKDKCDLYTLNPIDGKALAIKVSSIVEKNNSKCTYYSGMCYMEAMISDTSGLVRLTGINLLGSTLEGKFKFDPNDNRDRTYKDVPYDCLFYIPSKRKLASELSIHDRGVLPRYAIINSLLKEI